MGFFKNYFTQDKWKEFDPDWSFRDELIESVGRFDFAKLDGILTMYNALDQEFFRSGKFSRCPDEQKMTYFVDFLESWINMLTMSGLATDAQIVGRVCDKLKLSKEIAELPHWYKGLPEYIKPDPQQVDALENLRNRLYLDDEALAGNIASSPWAVIKTQEATLNQLRSRMPQCSERDLWCAVLLSRFQIKLTSPAPWDSPAEEILERMQSIESIMTHIHSWQDLISHILAMDEEGFSVDLSGIREEINNILSPG